mgnify:CR=1 FL=1
MKKNHISDSVLVKSYIQGDERSLEMLIKRHKQRIYNFIYSKVFDRDLTEDISVSYTHLRAHETS